MPTGPVYRGLRVDLAVNTHARVQVPPPPPPAMSAQVEVQAPAVEVQTPDVQGQPPTVEAKPPPSPPDAVPPPVPPVAVPQSPPAPPVAVALEGAPVVEFFGVPLDGAQDVVFVLDRSGSMANLARGRLAAITAVPAPAPAAPPAPSKIDVAKAELIDALGRLPAGTRMTVLFFNHQIEGSTPTIVALDEASRAGLTAFVTDIAPSGNTALAPVMRTAFLMNARRVILLSDGLGNVGGDATDVLRDAREAIRGGVRIDTIGIGPDADTWLLRALAEESGGLYQPL